VHSMTCNVWILMCHSGVGSILVIFNMLDCYILYMCLLLFVYCILYTCFGGSPTGEANKIGKKVFKKFLIFIGSPRTLNMAPGSAQSYVAYVHRPGGTGERKGLTFIGSVWPINVS
jgi:hypothetical protein